jgi:hypothetical protein
MRILCVNGNPLLNVTHNDAVNVLRTAGIEIEMLLAYGYDPKEVDTLRAEGKLPDKIVEILSNSEEAAAAAAQLSSTNKAEGAVVEGQTTNNKAAPSSVEKVMEVVKAAEQLVVPSSPTPTNKERAVTVPGSPGPVHDVKKTTIVMSGHSKCSPGLGGPKKFNLPEKDGHSSDPNATNSSNENLEPKPRTHYYESPTYANLHDLHNSDGRGSSDEVELEFIDQGDCQDQETGTRKTNGEVSGVGVETRNPMFNGSQSRDDGIIHRKFQVPTDLKLQSRHGDGNGGSVLSPPPVPTPRTSVPPSNGGGMVSPALTEEVSHF